MIDKTHLAVVMADVSGKGVPAALFMVIAKTLIKNYAQTGLEADEVFTTVNRMLCEGNDAGLFVTTWLGILDLATGKLSYANAGHNFPLVKLGEEDFSYLKVRTGFILAGMEDSKYRKKELYMKPGDRLFLYTYGNTEAENIEKELYGEERLQQFLNQHKEPQSSLGEGNGNLAQNIEILAGEDGMALDVNLHQQVAADATVGAHIAFTPDTDGLACIHTGGDLYLHTIGLADLALTLTGIAGVLHDLATAGAHGTGGGGLHLHAHEVLYRTDLATAAALSTGLNNAIGGTAAVTDSTVFDPLGSNFLLTAKCSFLEGQLQMAHNVLTPAGCILGALTAASAAAKELAEDITEVTEIAETAETGTVGAVSAATVAGIHTGKAELIIALALRVIGQDFVSFANFLELGLCFLVTRIPVGMVFHGRLTVGLLDFLGSGALLNAQNLIIIAFIFSHIVTS